MTTATVPFTAPGLPFAPESQHAAVPMQARRAIKTPSSHRLQIERPPAMNLFQSAPITGVDSCNRPPQLTLGSAISAARKRRLGAADGPARPVVIASANGLRAAEKAMQISQSGGDALDAVIAGVNLVEDDPNDTSVGYGGLPNEAGIVELDASVMHGPTGCGGAVAALQNIRNPSKVARLVMERSDHVLLVGAGA